MELVGGALRVPAVVSGGMFRAPEVAHEGGGSFLYYSVATEGLNHRLRVAVGNRPDAPCEDAGPLMSDADDCPFAIDADPFRDDDGTWYFFYCRDFLGSERGVRAGTRQARCHAAVAFKVCVR